MATGISQFKPDIFADNDFAAVALTNRLGSSISRKEKQEMNAVRM
jgi:hypothetical protein